MRKDVKMIQTGVDFSQILNIGFKRILKSKCTEKRADALPSALIKPYPFGAGGEREIYFQPFYCI